MSESKDLPLTPQQELKQRLETDAAARAAQALKEPLYPDLGPRCPRCGERLAHGKDPVPAACPRCKVEPGSGKAGELLVPPATWPRELLRGASYVPRGAFRLLRSPSLWKWAAVPLILNILVVVLSLWLASAIAGWLEAATGPKALENWNGVWYLVSWVVYVIGIVTRILVWIVIPVIASWLFFATPVGKLLFMPFMELMTESTDRIVLGFDEGQPFDFARIYANLIIAIIDAILLTCTQLVVLIVMLPINLVPIVGNAIWAIVPPSAFASMDYTDINLVRRRYTLREKVHLWRTHQWRFFGFGLSFFFLLTIPLVNLVVIPSAAVGGALLYLELDRK